MPMTRNQTKVMMEIRNRGPEPCVALFSEWAAGVVEDDGSTILQLNVKGLRDWSLIGRNFGLTTCGRPQLKLYYYYCYYDLGLRPVCGAGRRKLRPNLAPMPN